MASPSSYIGKIISFTNFRVPQWIHQSAHRERKNSLKHRASLHSALAARENLALRWFLL